MPILTNYLSLIPIVMVLKQLVKIHGNIEGIRLYVIRTAIFY